MWRGLAGPATAVAASLQIRSGEGRRTALLFTHLLLASMVFILGRTVRDTLFLSRYSLAALPWMFVFYGVASSITAALYSTVADRVARHRMIGASVAVGAASYLAVWVLVGLSATWIYPVFYVWSEVVSNLFIVQFWTLANDLYDARSAKRLFGLIGSARVLGVVVTGLTAGIVVRMIGTAQLLFVLMAMMIAIGFIVLGLRRERRVEVAGARRPVRATRPPSVASDPYVRALGLFILLAFAALTVGDYQFKAIARATYREDALAQFFAFFYAVTGVTSFLFQVLVTPRILGRLGVGWGMSVMPTVFGAASALLPFWPHLSIASVMKFSDNGFQYTIHETTLQALYVPFAAAVKARTRALLDAAVKPCAYGVGGILLILLAPRMPVQWLSVVSVVLTVGWLVLVRVVRARYVKTLESTLTVRGVVDLDAELVLDARGRTALLNVLERGRPREVRVAIERLGGEPSPEITRAIERLVGADDAQVRATALAALAGRHDARGEAVAGALVDVDPAVRAAAVRTYSTLARDEAVDALSSLVLDPDRHVRVAAVAGLLRDGGIEGDMVGGARLAALLTSASRVDRSEAAQVLGELGAGAYRPLRKLLDDADAGVRRAALRACPGIPDRRLVPDLIRLLQDPACRVRAGAALVAIGEPAVGPLLDLLGADTTPRAVRLLVPRLLRNVASPDTYSRLRGHVDVRDSQVRLRVYAALSRIRKAISLAPEPLEWIRERVRREIAEAERNWAAWARALPQLETPLLVEELRFRRQRAVRRVLRVLELRYERRALRLVEEQLGNPGRRANALETLDAVIDSALRPVVTPFVENSAAESPQERGAPAGVQVPEPEELFREECKHPNPYVALLVLDALARRAHPLGREVGAAALEHPEPLVREGAIAALTAADPGLAAGALPKLVGDPDETVARHARAHLAALAASSNTEALVHSTVEKILFLKSAPIFEKVSGEDLAPLARVAVEETYAGEERIFDQGEMGDALYVIVRGRVRISHDGETIATLGPGDAFGEMGVLDAAPRSATAAAAEETEVLRIGSEEFYETLHEQAEIAEGVIRMLTRRLREATSSKPLALHPPGEVVPAA